MPALPFLLASSPGGQARSICNDMKGRKGDRSLTVSIHVECRILQVQVQLQPNGAVIINGTNRVGVPT